MGRSQGSAWAVTVDMWSFRKELASRVFRQPLSCSGLQPNLVVDRLPQALLAPEVSFRGFH